MPSLSIDGGAGPVDRLPSVSTALEATSSELTFESHLSPASTERPVPRDESTAADSGVADEGQQEASANEAANQPPESDADEEKARSDSDADESHAADEDPADSTEEAEDSDAHQAVEVTLSSEVLEVAPEAPEIVVVEGTIPSGEDQGQVPLDANEQEVTVRTLDTESVEELAEVEPSKQEAVPIDLTQDQAEGEGSEAAPRSNGDRSRQGEPVRAAAVAQAEQAPAAANLTESATPSTSGSDADSEDSRSKGRSQQDRFQTTPATGSESPAERTEGPTPRFSDQLLPRSVSQGDRTVQLDSVQQARFVERVARAVQAAEARGEPLRLRLHPPELGALKLELRVQKGVLTARLETETAAARSILVDNLPVLRERLVEQGVRIDQFDVDLGGGAHSGVNEEAEQDANQSHDSSHSGRANPEESDEGSTVAPTRWSTGDDQIDIVV